MTLFHRKLGSGKPLVVLHGLFGASDNWLSVAKLLEEEYTLYLVDLRNHGQSIHSEDFNYDLMAEDLAVFIQEQELEGCHLMGHSMGGKVAMLFAALHRQLVEKLIIVDIGPKQYPLHHNEILKGLNSIPIAALKSRGEADAPLAEYVEEIGVRQFLLKNLQRGPNGFTWKINLPVLTQKIGEVVQALPSTLTYDGPTLFIRGLNSNYILDEDFSGIEMQYSDVQFESVADAGHWIHAEQPQVFTNIVKTFLNG